MCTNFSEDSYILRMSYNGAGPPVPFQQGTSIYKIAYITKNLEEHVNWPKLFEIKLCN